MLNNIKIVLVGTSHSGNIGSAARAMKVMGLSQLVLVSPDCVVDSQAIALAAGASDIALNAQVCDSLTEAIKDCQWVVGSSARMRALDWPMLDVSSVATQLVNISQSAPVAIVFGREKTGLTNDELQKCHVHSCVDANPSYSSLNLAMAVQIFAHEVRKAWLNTHVEGLADKAAPPSLADKSAIRQYPTHQEQEYLLDHVARVITHTEFIDEKNAEQIMAKLRRLLVKSQLEQGELNILRGILTSVERKMERK